MRVTTMRQAIVAAAVLVNACGESSVRSNAGTTDSAASSIASRAAIEIGSPLPEYRATTLSGAPVELGGHGGPLTLVNVWATWCTSCREEMQDLAAMYRDYGPRGLRVVAVSVDAGSERLVRRLVQRESLAFLVVHDQAGTIQKQYRVVGVPTNYLVGTDGRVLWQQVGGVHGNLPKVRVEVEKALSQ
jgi:cytochrome c biogenesis protein CcmG/thiol:disulfide interchange protein DsbE